MRTVRQIIDVYCDVCHAESGTDTEADEADAIRVTVAGRARRLDVCAPHKDPPWSAVLAYAVDDLDASPPVSAPRTAKSEVRGDPGTCPICHSEFGWLSTHGTSAHGVRVDSLPKNRAGDYKCPDCDYAAGVMRLSQHYTRAHGRRIMHVLLEREAAKRKA